MSNKAGHTTLPFVFVDYATNPVDALANDVIALNKPDPSNLSHITIWCESRASIHTIKLKVLNTAKAHGLPGLLFPNILTLEDWLWQQHTPDKPLISETSKQLLLVEAIRQSPGLFQTNNAWPLAKELVSLFNECTLAQVPLTGGQQALKDILIKSYDFPTPEIDNISRESEIVYALWQAYQEQIHAHNWVDPIAHYCQCLLNVSIAKREQHYYLIGKHRLATVEALFLNTLSDTHCISIYYPNISNQQLGTQGHAYTRFIKEQSSTLDTDNIREQALNLIYDQSKNSFERIKIFKSEFPENPFNSWLSIYNCASIEKHANAVCMQAKKWLLEENYPIGIVINDRLLARRIRAVLEEEGITPNDLGGWTLSTTSAATAIEVLLDAIEKNFKKDALLDLLSSPFLPQINSQDAVYTQQLYAVKKLLKQHISIPSDSIDTFITLINQASQPDDSTYEHILALCKSLKEIISPLQSHYKHGEYDLCKFSEQLLSLLNSLGIEETLKADAAGIQLLDTLKANIISIRTNSIKLNWNECRQWLRDLFESNYFIPETSDNRITLCGFEHIDDLNFKTAIIAGIEENRLTINKQQRTFFNEKVRHELHLATYHESNAINFVRFRQLLEQCEQLLLSAEIETHGEPQELSSWVKLIELFSQQVYSTSLQKSELDELVKQKTIYQTEQSSLKINKTNRPNPSITNDLLPRKVSATQYQSLIDCPYQYFAKYILELRKLEKTEDFEASEFGKLVHQSLHEFHFTEMNKAGLQFNQDNRNKLIDQLNELSTNLFMRAIFPNTVKQGWLQRWINNIPSYIDWTIERNHHWKILRGEYTLEHELNDVISLQGQIDRIDTNANEYAVIDYKTGSTLPSKKNALNGEAVQLPFYALLDKRINQVEYLNLGIQDGIKSAALIKDEELEELKAEHIDRLHSLKNQLHSDTGLSAQGDDSTCRVCDYQGLCRKAHWQQV